MESPHDNMVLVNREGSVSGGNNFDFQTIQSEKEQALIQSIKALAKENESVKKSLSRHNQIIESYCKDLENLKRQCIKEKEKKARSIEELQLQAGLLLSLDKDRLLERIVEQLQVFEKEVCTTDDEQNLTAPVQETQRSLLMSIQDNMQQLRMSLNVQQYNTAFSAKQSGDLSELKVKISQLKEQLAEEKGNNERLISVERALESCKAENLVLLSEKEAMKKKINAQQQVIERLEFEPSVEVMQIASPEQTKAIESLNLELKKANGQVSQLSEENDMLLQKISSLSKANMQLIENVSPDKMAKDPKSIEFTIQTLREQIEQQSCINSEVEKAKHALQQSLIEEQKRHSKDLEELQSLKLTNELMRKTESKDLDKLNQVTFQRDNYKKEVEEKVLVIQNLHRQLQGLDKGNSLSEEFTQIELNDSSDVTKKFERLARQLSKGEEMVGILVEENTNLKEKLKTMMENCHCEDLEGKITELVEENEKLQAVKSDSEELLKKNYYEEKARRENLEMNAKAIQEHQVDAERKFKEQQDRDGKIIQHMKEELENMRRVGESQSHEVHDYIAALENARQQNSVYEESLAKSKKDFAKLWKNFQAKLAQISSLEERRKELDDLFMKERIKLDETLNDNRMLTQELHQKKSVIQKLNDDVQTLDAYQQQVKIYEADFKMEREAREKQQSDILVLREDIHRLKLENDRLHEDVESTHKQSLYELQKRYGPMTQASQGYKVHPTSGIYGRGAQAPDSRMNYSMARNSSRNSFDAPPQKSDQVMQRACPKCHTNFPDLDTLQIHVLECVD